MQQVWAYNSLQAESRRRYTVALVARCIHISGISDQMKIKYSFNKRFDNPQIRTVNKELKTYGWRLFLLALGASLFISSSFSIFSPPPDVRVR